MKVPQTVDNTTSPMELIDNFIGVTKESHGFYNFCISSKEMAQFNSEERLSNSFFEFFILDLINNPQNKIYNKKEFLILTFDFLRNAENMRPDAMKQIFEKKNILEKKYILIPFQSKEGGEWVFAIVENMFINFSNEVFQKLNLTNVNLKDQAKIKLFLFESRFNTNVKQIKNLILNKVEKFYLNYINMKFNIKYQKCFKTEKIYFEPCYVKLLNNNNDFNNAVILIKIVYDLLCDEISISNFLKNKDLSKFDFLPCLEIVKQDLNKILQAYFNLNPNAKDNIQTNQEKKLEDDVGIRQTSRHGGLSLSISNLSDNCMNEQDNSLSQRGSLLKKNIMEMGPSRMTHNNIFENPLKKLNLMTAEERRMLKDNYRQSVRGDRSYLTKDASRIKYTDMSIKSNEDDEQAKKTRQAEVNPDNGLLKLKQHKFEIGSAKGYGSSLPLSKAIHMIKGVNFDLLDQAFRKSKYEKEAKKEQDKKIKMDKSEDTPAPQRGNVEVEGSPILPSYMAEKLENVDDILIPAKKPVHKSKVAQSNYTNINSNYNTCPQGPSGSEEKIYEGVQSGFSEFNDSTRKTKAKPQNNTTAGFKDKRILDLSESILTEAGTKQTLQPEESSCCAGSDAKCLIF